MYAQNVTPLGFRSFPQAALPNVCLMSTNTNHTDSRRQFLRQAGLTAAAATLAGPVAALPFAEVDSPLQYDDQRKVGFAIVGLGK